MGEGKVRLGMLFRVSALLALALVLVQSGVGSASLPTASTVVTNPNFETLAVDPSGVAWGTPTANKSQLWKSGDEGATWTQVTGWNAIGKQPWYITPLQSGALLAAYNTGTNWAIARSADGGATWTTVLLLPCMNQSCTLRYTTLTQKSITQGDGYVFLGTYNNNPATVNTNYIYRSGDDGQTWSVVNTPTTMRHIHGLAFDQSKHRLYVFGGDSVGDGLWYSSDDGSTLQ